MKPTVLLTGGFGNIGGRVSSAMSDLQIGEIKLSSRQYRTAPSWAPTALPVHLDLLSTTSVIAALQDVAQVVHLASMNDIDCAADPKLASQINVTGTKVLLESAISQGVSRFIYFSTIQVYGSPLDGHISENSHTNPVHPYGATHLSAENLVINAHQAGLIEGIVLRCSNGFGVPMDPEVRIWQILVNDLCKQAVLTEKLVLKSDGSQLRNFIPLEDVCRGIIHSLSMSLSANETPIFNLGSSHSCSVLDMAQLIAQRCQVVLGFTPPITKSAQSTGESSSNFKFDCSKFNATGYLSLNHFENEVDGLLLFCKKHFDRVK
jgi:UDP-glucose 4-epimerase